MHINLCMHGRLPHLLRTKEIYGNQKDLKKQNPSDIFKKNQADVIRLTTSNFKFDGYHLKQFNDECTEVKVTKTKTHESN